MCEVKHLTKQQILDTIKDLSRSQGLYSRLYQSLKDLEQNDPEQYNSYMEHLQAQNFKDSVDLVLYFEC